MKVRRRSPTIRARLALLVVASAAPAVALAAALLVIGHRAERERLVGGSVDTARAMVHSIDAELVSLTTAAEVLAMEMAAHNVEAAKRNATPLSVLFIDLDGFKQVNDRLGHDAGDQLLCAVAERLRGAARRSDVAARVGGDEFAMLLLGVDADASAALASKVSAALAEPFQIAGRTVGTPASVGTASYPESGSNAHDLLNRADDAMYRKKSAKRGVAT